MRSLLSGRADLEGHGYPLVARPLRRSPQLPSKGGYLEMLGGLSSEKQDHILRLAAMNVPSSQDVDTPGRVEGQGFRFEG